MNKKILVSGCVLLLSIGAQASTDDPSDTSSNNLVNLNYYNHTGQFLFAPTVSSAFHATSDGNSFSSTDVAFVLSYGMFVDGLRFAITEDDDFNAYSQPGTSFYYTGLSNPDFSLNYRVMDMTASGISLDVQFSVSPSTGTRSNALSGTPGSNSSGSPNIDLSTGLYWTRGLNEVELSGGIYREFAGSGFDPFLVENYVQTSYWEGSTELIDRVHVTPKFFVEGSATFLFGHSTDFVYPDGSGNLNQYSFHVEPRFEVGYLHSKQFLLTAFITYNGYTETQTDNLLGSQNQYDNIETSWGMRMSIEF